MISGIRTRRLALAVVAGLTAVVVGVAARATASPEPFLLTFDGAHFPDTTLHGGGLRHDGRFTASAPFCSAGRAFDVVHYIQDGLLSVQRLHTCDDGTGSFTAFMPTVRNEHGGTTGTWKIVDGTGRYATLRGLGAYDATLISGNPDLFETISYRTAWRGLVGFDADPPTIKTLDASARKVRRRPRTYDVRVVLSFEDASAPVSYTADVRAGQTPVGFKQGSAPGGQTATVLRVKTARAVRSVRVVLKATDSLGNETTAMRTVGLR
jgi:hypothetical protein